MTPKKIMIVAGEGSGDLHGALLARELHRQSPGITLLGAGGPRMASEGVKIVEDITRYASIGIVDAMMNIKHYLKLSRMLLFRMRSSCPDCVVLIDMPDFNLRLAPHVKAMGIPLVYYISPQLWAWREGRVNQIRKWVDRMVVIFPFEKEFYATHGVRADYVGHPLVDRMDLDRSREEARSTLGIGVEERVIGLLPGSRTKEVHRLFGLMKDVAGRIRGDLPDIRFIVAAAPGIPRRLYEPLGGMTFFEERTYDVMRASDLLITASGTATVEAALIGTPMIVTYRMNLAAILIFLPFIKTRKFAMVNIIAGREICPEYYQFKARADLIAKEAVAIFTEGRLGEMREALGEVRRKLAEPGDRYGGHESAPARAASVVLETATHDSRITRV